MKVSLRECFRPLSTPTQAGDTTDEHAKRTAEIEKKETTQ
jgi:hypothetical protein